MPGTPLSKMKKQTEEGINISNNVGSNEFEEVVEERRPLLEGNCTSVN